MLYVLSMTCSLTAKVKERNVELDEDDSDIDCCLAEGKEDIADLEDSNCSGSDCEDTEDGDDEEENSVEVYHSDGGCLVLSI